MEDYRVFHDLLIDTIPSDRPTPGLIDVAIVYHDPASGKKSKGVHTSRFHCRPSLRVASLVKNYRKRYPGLGDVTFFHNDEEVADETKVKTLVSQTANFIALQALPASWRSASSHQGTSSALLEARQACVHLAAPTSKLQLQADVNLSSSISQALAFIANVDELCDDRSADELEACARKAAKLLEAIIKSLQKHKCPDTTRKEGDIEALLRQFIQPYTTIAGVGATGSGKSSLINALLGLPHLIPTGCTSACTSVATEIAYNWKDSAYRAEIRFMQKSAWKQMLERLFHDIRDENGSTLHDVDEEGSESAIALAQLITVYPHLDVKHLENVSIDELMDSDRLKDLGTFIPLHHTNPHSFSEELRQYLSSESGLWPLIASVKVFVRSPALATGAVIVDLPGVLDTNQARSRIAKKYMQNCDHIFVVSPMKRAVDDSVAHNLVSMAPKEQVQLDGLYCNATFIGTFSDDVNPREVSEAYHLQSEFKPLFDELSALAKDRKSLEDQVKKAGLKKASLVQKLTKLEEKGEELRDQREDCSNGKPIFVLKSTKRKSQEQPEEFGMPPKKLKVGDAQPVPSMTYSSDAEPVAEPSTKSQRPLSISAITKMMDKNAAQQEKLSLSVKQASCEYGELQGELDKVRANHLRVDSKIRELAIINRNEHTSRRIRDDFARGYRGLVQAWESEQSAEDRARTAQDIAQVKQRLSVFMVSSAAYQAFQGSQESEDGSKGFKETEATEIPQLQEHCRRLTDDARTKAYRRFLTDVLQSLASLQRWSSEVEIQGNGLSNFEQRQEKKSRKEEQQLLKRDLEKLAAGVVQDVRNDIKHRLYTAFEKAVMIGRAQAGYSAIGWGLKRDQGGLHFQTYRAVLKHEGVFTSSKGREYDFNKQIGADFKRRLGREWELFFTRLLPDAMNKLPTEGSKILENFFEKFCERNNDVRTPVREIEDLRRQLPNYKEDLVSMANEILDDVQSHQRQVNRQGVEPVILGSMQPIYQQWSAFSGKGMLERMRNAVESHVSTIVAPQDPATIRIAPGVFESCRDTLKSHIDDMVQRKIKDKSVGAMKTTIEAICRSCNDLGMGPSATVDTERMDQRLKNVHKEVRDLLTGANSLLLEAVLGEQVLEDADEDGSLGSESGTAVARRTNEKLYEDKSYIVIDSDDEMDIDY